MIAAGLVLLVMTIVIVATVPDLERFASAVRLGLTMFIVWAALTWRFADPVFDRRESVPTDGGATAGPSDAAVRRAADRAARTRLIVSIVVAVAGGIVFAVGAGIPSGAQPSWLAPVLLHVGAIACSAGVAGAAAFATDGAPVQSPR